MIKIKKLLLQNFKGSRKPLRFDFANNEANVNILSGPNGFGKTTVFDAIELCLTGNFNRVDKFNDVQKKNSNRTKPFFQNTDGENVIIKLWLYEQTTNTDYIIIKLYDDILSPTRAAFGRDFIPSDAKNIFTTYLTSDRAYFDNNNLSELQPSEQTAIKNIFYDAESNIDLSSTYYLFNYIQQEDSIYFLRKEEKEKGSSLSFLFNIEKEENELQTIDNLRGSLSSQLETIEGSIIEIKASLADAEVSEYNRLFPDKDFGFDSEVPFEGGIDNKERVNQFQEIITSLRQFRDSFSPDEYEKSLKFKKLNEDVLINQNTLRAILLKNIYTDKLIEEIEQANTKLSKAKIFLLSNNTEFIAKSYFDLFPSSTTLYNEYLLVEKAIREIDRELGETGRMLSALNSGRKTTLDEFGKLVHIDHISAKNCPLCNSLFDTFELLEQAINSQTTSLEEFNTEKLAQKTKLQQEISNFHAQIHQEASTFIAKNILIESSVISAIREYQAFANIANDLFESYPLLSSPNMAPISFTTHPKSLDEINQKTDLLKEFISNTILPQYIYDDSLIANKQLYADFFDSNREKFLIVTSEMLAQKLQFVLGSYTIAANSRISFLEGRKEKLNTLISHVSSIYGKIYSTIKSHKVEMIEKIKVPFYIYSGKILQSYQQGLGIFIEIHQTPLSNSVRFRTGHSSDHDIVYHLSSGQLAVASLAFCLALNKCYNTNENFKFLAIDDPVQTMDDMNIHTFIELVRNEFNDFQLIMSTHDDFTSRYMKYKFDKSGMNTEIQNVQKIALEQSFES